VAVALSEAIAKFGNPQRMHSRAKMAQLSDVSAYGTKLAI
jgi:hypothetical protein